MCTLRLRFAILSRPQVAGDAAAAGDVHARRGGLEGLRHAPAAAPELEPLLHRARGPPIHTHKKNYIRALSMALTSPLVHRRPKEQDR